MNLEWPPIYIHKRHRAAKHIYLRFSENHELVVTTPIRCSRAKILSALNQHQKWVLSEISQRPEVQPIQMPNQIPLYGGTECWQVRYLTTTSMGKLIQTTQNELVVLAPIESQKCIQLLIKWLKQYATECILKLVDFFSKQLGISYQSASVRKQKSMWGCCHTDGRIFFNLNLIFLPKHLMDYVIIHELCHLVHFNHSKDFWRLVGSFDVNFHENRKEIKQANQWIPSWYRQL